MNNLKDIPILKNRYFVMRHGESKANIQSIILSNPKKGIGEFGLTEKGKNQVKESIKKNNILNNETLIFSSDFLRAKETAEIVKNILKINKIYFDISLRERNFGIWEGTNNENYKKVWEEDKINPNNKKNNTESAEEVLDRTTKLIIKLEKLFEDKKILLISHGDALQILQTGFLKISPSEHRELPHLEIAEIRELKLKIN